MKRTRCADQLDLFLWADTKPSNVIDAKEAFWRKAALDVINPPRRPADGGKVISIGRKAA
jgi:hypothetical protein